MAKYLDKRDKGFGSTHQKAIKQKDFFLQDLFKPVLRILKIVFNLKVSGKENVPSGNFLIAPAHYSVLDPFILAAAKRDLLPLRFVAKSQVFRFPFTQLLINLLISGQFLFRRAKVSSSTLSWSA
jgi:1-acyl-sn-glycerol-3-phosphate acyltransferase